MHKWLIGERLANIATQLVYGDQNDYFGLSFDQITIKGQEILISFKHVGAGLKIKFGVRDLQRFAIAGSDRKFVLANARIVSTRVAIYTPVHDQKTLNSFFDSTTIKLSKRPKSVNVHDT